MSERKPLMVRWVDAYANGQGWMSEDDIPSDPVIVRTIGFLVRKTDHAITLAQSHSIDKEEEEFINYQTIPLGIVLGIDEVEAKCEP